VGKNRSSKALGKLLSGTGDLSYLEARWGEKARLSAEGKRDVSRACSDPAERGRKRGTGGQRRRKGRGRKVYGNRTSREPDDGFSPQNRNQARKVRNKVSKLGDSVA